MSNIIQLKRSAIQGNTPTVGELSLGELCINTYDGKLFIKKDNGTESIIEVGSDPWTYVKLSSDYVVSTTTNSDSFLRFTPSASTHYVVEGMLFLQTAATTTGARPGIKWPTGGINQNIAWVTSSMSVTTFASRFWGGTTTANAASTAIGGANKSFYGKIEASFVTSPYPNGDFIITLASEVNGSVARLMTNSFIRYRSI